MTAFDLRQDAPSLQGTSLSGFIMWALLIVVLAAV